MTWEKRVAVSIRVVSESLLYNSSFRSGAEGGFCSGVQSLIPEQNTILLKTNGFKFFLNRITPYLGLF